MTVLKILNLKYGLFLLFLFTNNCTTTKPASTQETSKQTTTKKKRKKPPIPYLADDDATRDTLLQTTHFQFISHQANLKETQIKNLSVQCEATMDSLLKFIGTNKKLPIINYHLYPSVEQKALRKKGIETTTIETEKNNIYVVVNQNFQGSQLHHENKLVLHQLLGTPKIAALEEGLSNHFTKNWQRKGYSYWCGKLFQSQNLPTLKELVDKKYYEKESYLVLGAMSGVFVDFLLAKFGKADFLKNYATWTSSDLSTLDNDWQAYLKEQYSDFSETTSPATQAIPYLKGFNFAHEGYRIYNGYGSQLAKESLEKLATIGTNAIAIVPYSFMRNPNIPSQLLIDHRDGGENDESVLFSHFEAQRLGMHTMLKPQIWLRGSWPGDVDMSSEQDWNRFFDNYYSWLRHYALLAEINEFDSVCLGVEFAKATLLKEQEWRQLIQQIRGIYSGPITYAANWGDEFEQLKFWDALDFIGINCYYPLSAKAEPSKRELKKAWQGILSKIEQVQQTYNKPVVFTEIGFRSVESTWKNPHAEAKGRAFNEKTQALAYEVIFEGIQGKDWCKGILWWKWPSYLDYKGPENTGFTPADKKAEKVVERWFKK